MTRDEARQILEAARANGRDDTDPRVAEALRLADQDPELAGELERQRALDATMIAGMSSISVPADLKQSILAGRKIVKPHFWQDWRTATAAAAAIAVLVAGAIYFINQSTRGFAAFRRQLVVETWAGDPHLDLETDDLSKVRAWLAGQGAATNFTLPAALAGARVHGARVFEYDGHMISQVCLAEGPRHLHLYVLDRPPFSDLPPVGAPDFEKCGGWKTASWRQGNTTYVLTGMSYQAFVSRFRKAGRWILAG
ncbi:MAG TPA: hypothetical protein VFT34_01295 [Verrucomicrobiae bacterium]|nr:hypothetical protein [Verrucomicrobiae bacterium]